MKLKFLITSFVHTISTLEKAVFKINVWNWISYFLPQTVHPYYYYQFLGYLQLKQIMTSFL